QSAVQSRGNAAAVSRNHEGHGRMIGSVTTRYASDGCDHEPAPILSVEQVQRYLIERVLPVAGKEVVAPETALGRVLAEDQRSLMNIPGADNSAMDGYALASRDI